MFRMEVTLLEAERSPEMIWSGKATCSSIMETTR